MWQSLSSGSLTHHRHPSVRRKPARPSSALRLVLSNAAQAHPPRRLCRTLSCAPIRTTLPLYLHALDLPDYILDPLRHPPSPPPQQQARESGLAGATSHCISLTDCALLPPPAHAYILRPSLGVSVSGSSRGIGHESEPSALQPRSYGQRAQHGLFGFVTQPSSLSTPPSHTAQWGPA